MTETIREFPGVPLSDADFTEKRVLTTLWRPDLRYAWDAGTAVGRFLLELKQGRLIGTRCSRCRRVVVPPRVFCEECFRPADEWVHLPDTGRVNTFSISYVAWDARRVKEPTIPAVIELDGASPGVGILHLLGEIEPDPANIKTGMAVQAVWKPRREREGAITDIRYFRPVR